MCVVSKLIFVQFKLDYMSTTVTLISLKIDKSHSHVIK